MEFCKHAVQSSANLTVLPAQLIVTELERGILCRVDAVEFSWRRPIALHYRKGSIFSAGVVAMIDSLHRAAAKCQRIGYFA